MSSTVPRRPCRDPRATQRFLGHRTARDLNLSRRRVAPASLAPQAERFAMIISRRRLLALLPAALVLSSQALAQGRAMPIRVHKTPWCGCCGGWVEHLRQSGFAPTVLEHQDLTPVARRLGVPDSMRSCHSAEVGGYFVEGHVPAADIRKLLKERPKAAGLAIPGMLVGPPGMEQPGRDQSYSTLLIDRSGHPSVFVDHSI